ncbi:hypothetical protein UlMin_032661 [Ulmus minor]
MEMEKREIQGKKTTVRHNHEHPMREGRAFFYISYRTLCDLCQNDIWEYKDLFFQCSKCLYFLHKSCGELLLYINHSFHPLHSARITRLDNITCFYCEKSYPNALMYSCHQCSFHIHSSCSMIPIPIISCDNQNHVQYTCHDRPMTPVERYNGVIIDCFACQLPWSSGPVYTCQQSCKNILHKECAALPQKIEHSSLHPHHPLKLQISGLRSCNACYKRDCRLIFRCEECNFNFCTECAFLIPTVRWRRHNHPLFLMERGWSVDHNCYVCNNTQHQVHQVKDEVRRTRSLLFRCMEIECDLNIHFLCGPLPRIIKHKCHVDPLILVDSIKGDDSNECYCDICEDTRNKQFRVYYCVICKYVAHIHCVLKALKGEQRDVELIAVGDARWMMPNNDVEATRRTTSTLSHIMQTLTQREREKLRNPFDLSSSLKAYIKQRYERKREENSGFECKGDNQDIQRIQNLFNLSASDFQENYLDEFDNFIAKEGLKMEEMYLKMNVVEVEGYQVPETLEPLLRTLLRKYGDLGGWSSVTPQMKSIGCTFLCIVLDRMSTIKLEDITKDLLLQWYFYLDSIRSITHFKIAYSLRDRLKKLIATFVGREAIRFKTEMVTRLEKRIAEIEELQKELETSKVDLVKLRSYGDSTGTEFIKDNIHRSLELKWKDALEVLDFENVKV